MKYANRNEGINVPVWQPKKGVLDGLKEALEAVRNRNDERLFWLEGECTNKVYKRYLRLVAMGVFFANEGPMNNNLLSQLPVGVKFHCNLREETKTEEGFESQLPVGVKFHCNSCFYAD